MSNENPLKSYIDGRIEELGLTRGDLGRRISQGNPTKALRHLDKYLEKDSSPKREGFTETLAEALEVDKDTIRAKEGEAHRLWRQRSEERYRAEFVPHAIWVTERDKPSSNAMGGLINVTRRRVMRLPASMSEERFVAYCLENAPEGVPLMGRVVGFLINYNPDRAIRYDLEGRVVETQKRAERIGIRFEDMQLPEK